MVPSAPLHILKFNYDATTPLVNITLSIYPSPQPAVEGKESIQEEEEIKVIYSGIHDGGFNKVFNLPHSSAIDLSSAMSPMSNVDMSMSQVDLDDKNIHDPMHRDTNSEDTNRSSIERSMGNLHMSSTQPDLATVPEMSATQGNEEQTQRNGLLGRVFGRRGRREADLEAGQIEMTDRQQEAEAEKQAEEEKEPEKGMRLLIRIEGVGAEGEH